MPRPASADSTSSSAVSPADSSVHRSRANDSPISRDATSRKRSPIIANPASAVIGGTL